MADPVRVHHAYLIAVGPVIADDSFAFVLSSRASTEFTRQIAAALEAVLLRLT